MSTPTAAHDTAAYAIGDTVTAGLQIAGRLDRVVIDPLARQLTHLVVTPLTRPATARLVPVALVDPDGTGIALRCTLPEFDALPPAQVTHFLPGAEGRLGYAAEHLYSWPYYGLTMGGMGMGAMSYGGGPANAVIADRVPPGEMEIRRGDPVHASDGAIGKVQGLVVDRADQQVTHLLLQEGHLWGRKQVAIPISAVLSLTDGLQLNLTKHQIEALPGVDVDQIV